MLTAKNLASLLAFGLVLSCSDKPPERIERSVGRPAAPMTGTGNSQGTNNGGVQNNTSGGTSSTGNPDSKGTVTPGETKKEGGGDTKTEPGPVVKIPDGGGTVIPETKPTDSNDPLQIEIKGRQLLVNGKAFFMRSIAYNPVKKGRNHPEGLIYKNPSEQDLKDIERDMRLIKEMGGNTIRTYDVIRDNKVLDIIKKNGLYVIVPALNYFGTGPDTIRDNVEALKSHPTTLLWELGNEWNYNALYGNKGGADGAKEQIKAAAKQIKALDKTHPTSSVYGEMPNKGLVDEMGDIDVWGINVYSGLSFGNRFNDWKGLSGKPLYVGEYGADAINKTTLDVPAQSLAVTTLSKQIMDNLSKTNAANALIGGSVFEFCDEWWKDGGGKLDVQEIGGIAPGGGPHPDAVFNEEWWGVVDIDRNPRPAYNDLKAIWSAVKD